MWRYSLVLPDAKPVTLGEGWTPMLQSRRYANVFLKEEGANPTSTFKARGLAHGGHHGAALRLEEAGRALGGECRGRTRCIRCGGGDRSAYLHAEGRAFANLVEAKVYGANVTLVDGLISDCGRMVAERKEKEGWFDISTLKEPFRVEGKKTMGYELVEQLGLGISRCGFLSHGRRSGTDRNVEGFY